MQFEIITDSSANLTEALIDQYQIHILSLLVRAEGEDKEYYSYVKGEHTDIKPFYDMMRAGKVLKTAAINAEECQSQFEALLKEGKDILYIGFSSALSGTYQTASMVLEELKSAYPDRKIFAIDSLAASMGEGLLVYHAANLREAGKTIEEVAQWVEQNKLHLCHWFTVDDLFFLKRGGRVSGSTALLGTMLGIKPIMHVDDAGKLVPVGKVRGRRNSLDSLVKKMSETCIDPKDQMVFISHGDCVEDAEYVAEQVRAKLRVKDVVINFVDPVIGAHSGPGTIALFFLGTRR